MIDRRRALSLALAAGASASLAGFGARRSEAQQAGAQQSGLVMSEHPLQQSWQAWKARYMTPEGRVIDDAQDDASHSEGQGYGLTLAVTFGDQDAFARIYEWTETNLTLRQDPLLAWRWHPDTYPPVPDRNNASDGDLFYAWALMRGGRLFGNPALTARANEIATTLASHCIVEHPDGGGRLLFLPAAAGFGTPDGFIINPSYYMARAMRELASAFGIGTLATCANDGLALLAQLGQAAQMPDWIEVTAQGMRPAEAFSADSGYEAMRVPLFLLWSGAQENAALATFSRAHEAAAGDEDGTPTRFDRLSGAVQERSAHVGYGALPALARCAASGMAGSSMPPFTDNQPYYPATLQLMTMIAQVEVYPRCVPI
ncbi:glycosyl hydrolase family 8 [Halodurantibacterium flavum]|uniref:cellulase n=1 Tax=Halodurantibacterium flavum TaxID=1382802 RepID=A0ABW4S6D0_9RHOB